MAQTLAEFLSKDLPDFRSSWYYEPITDSLLIYAENKRSYAKRISKHFTLFLANSDNTFVGFEIKGVKDICKALDSQELRAIVSPIDVDFEDGPCEISVMARVATIRPEVEINASEYESIEQVSKGLKIDLNELQSC